MKNNKFRTIKTVVAMFIVTVTLHAAGFSARVVRSASGANPAAIQATVDQFRTDLGGANNGVGGSFTSGRREINWDGVPDTSAAPTNLPPNFFNLTSPRGVVFDKVFGPFLRVSADSNNPTTAAVRFGDVDASYTANFQTFSAERLFAVTSSSNNSPNGHLVEIVFFIPGTNIPATVSGFGAIFSDVDNTGNAHITCFDENGNALMDPGNGGAVLEFNGGLSFHGVSFNQGERIARVRIQSGRKVLSPGNVDGSGANDMVAMDDFIYGEPRAAQYHASDFDGDGTSDFAVYRPSAGAWFILNSGSNTFSAFTFGTNGDIPVEGDFDGDRRTDVTVFRPSTGTWFRLDSSNNGFSATNFGSNGDKPSPGDYDKDGKTDIAVWRPSSGSYFILRSSDSAFQASQWGANGDIPIGASPQ